MYLVWRSAGSGAWQAALTSGFSQMASGIAVSAMDAAPADSGGIRPAGNEIHVFRCRGT